MLKFSKSMSVLLPVSVSLAVAFSLNVDAGEQSMTVPQVDLGIKSNGEYHRVSEYDVPKEHTIGDGTIAYEGPGIESGKVAYRLYLDERSVLDVFGKKTADPVLHKVGRGDDYHVMSDWGMDILKVGNSLGSGGLGVYENGKMRMVGPARSLSVQVADQNPETASFVVNHEGLDSDSGAFNLKTQYSMEKQSRLLTVQAQSSQQAPVLAAGLVIHPGIEFLKSENQPESSWAYIATYGVQTLIDDELGLALFYQTDAVSEVKDDGSTYGVVFNVERPIHYKVAAAWVAEPGGIVDFDAYKQYLEEERALLDSTDASTP